MASNRAVCIVDQDDTIGKALSTLLRRYDIPVQAWSDTDNFRTALAGTMNPEYCLLLGLEPATDISIPLTRELRSEAYRFPIIILTSGTAEAIRDEAIAAGATDVIEKALVYPYLFSRLNHLFPGSLTMPANVPSTVKLKDGTAMVTRMIEPADAQMHQKFVTGLTPRSRYLRFFSGIRELSPYILRELTSPDFPCSHAIVGTIDQDGEEKEIGIARYAPTGEPGVAEFAVVVDDEWQGLGLARQLMRGIILSAAVAGFRKLEGVVLRENAAMLGLASHLGFETVDGDETDAELNTIRVSRDLEPQAYAP